MTSRLVGVGCICLLICFETAMAAELNVITALQTAFQGNEDMRNVLRYLNLAKDDLSNDLPIIGADGKKLSYTFFAPKNWAFVRMLPQDTFDPFYVDKQLRYQTLLHHFVRRNISKQDLSQLTGQLVMADGKESTITRENNSAVGSIPLINGGSVDAVPIQLADGLGVVYVIDKVFTTTDAIEAALSRHPVKESPWGPLNPPVKPPVEAVEAQTVVVDLLAEFFSETKK